MRKHEVHIYLYNMSSFFSPSSPKIYKWGNEKFEKHEATSDYLGRYFYIRDLEEIRI